MSLIKAVRGALVSQHTKSSMDTAIASRGLATSKSAIELLGKAGRTQAIQAGALTRQAMNGNITQKQTDGVATGAKKMVNQARSLKIMKPHFIQAMKSWEQAERDRADMMKAAGKAAQNVAVLNSSAQDVLRFGHQEAHAQTVFNSYGEL